MPYRDVKLSLGCFCDNTSSLYNTPITVTSYSRTMELIFNVTRLNISEDFADIYFYASYEFIKTPECRRKMRLKGLGGEEVATFSMTTAPTHDVSCEGTSWIIEAQEHDRSLFVLTYGTFLPQEYTTEDSLRCNTKNRLIVYSGNPLKILRIICPSIPGPRQTALHIFSEEWTAPKPSLFPTK